MIQFKPAITSEVNALPLQLNTFTGTIDSVLRHTRHRAGEDARDMGTVAVAVLDAPSVAEVDVDAGTDATLELDVRRPDARVDHVRRHAGSGRAVGVRAVEGWVELVDAVEAPWCTVLDGVDLDDLIDVDVGHRWVTSEAGPVGWGSTPPRTCGGVVPLLHDIDTEVRLFGHDLVQRVCIVDLDDEPLGTIGR